jgi:hypothetical protein|tara:strand:- start:216 stop:653 length:438 start_codon:yes stop_codon:yes gene_type:complete
MEKVRDTKLGAWLKEKAPVIFDVVANALPDAGLLGVVKNLVDKDPGLTPESKLEFQKLEQQERISLENNITSRWVADVQSQSWLARNVRPAIVLSLTSFLIIFILLDSFAVNYEIREPWIRLYETILVTTVGGYFVVRSVDKRKK